ncbi:MAG: gliding motility-associated C-terminal domain-containing protein [Bacteroidia bacterium]|nr:gliding motility-associated C-terminal domain-containing protein [Bacteroidia bacterium]
MKKLLLIIVLLSSLVLKSQRDYIQRIANYKFSQDSLLGFDEQAASQEALRTNCFGDEYKVFMYYAKRDFIKQKYNLHNEENNDVFEISMTWKGYGNGENPVPTGTPCVNEDFETGTLTGWTNTTGNNSNSCTMAGCCGGGAGLVWIMTTPFSDPIVGTIPASPFGGTKVAKINDNATGARVARLTQIVPVTSSNALFQFAYIAVLQNPGHTCCQQPYIKIDISTCSSCNASNCSNTPLTCPKVDISPPTSGCPALPGGWTQSGGVAYTPTWQIGSVDLTQYIGQCVMIRITVGDCAAGGHYGYCYFDARCMPMTLNVNGIDFPAGSSNVYVNSCGISTATLTAPSGLAPYTWNGPPGSGIVNNNNQTITTSVSGNYTLVMNPPGVCTPITKTVQINISPNPTAGFSFTNNCNTFTLANTGTGSPAVQTYSFIGSSAPSSFTTTANTSTVIFPNPGTYTIMQTVTNSASCTATYSTIVNVPTPPNPAFTINNPIQCLSNNAFVFTAAYTNGSHQYSFSPTSGAPPSSNVQNYGPVSFSAPGTYTVTHTVVDFGCVMSTQSVVTINPMPVVSTSYTNATCGNNNGIIVINNLSPPGQFVSSYQYDGSNIPTSTIINVPAGTHTVGIINNFGCSTQTIINISNTPPITNVSYTTYPATCGNNNGVINVTNVIGGTSGYQYSLNGVTYTASPSFSGLAPGNYSLYIQDIIGCTYSTNVSIISAPGPSGINFQTAPSACVGSTGSFTINAVIGGTSPYSYVVDGIGTNVVTFPLGAGIHTASIIDANSCVYTTTFAINTIPGPSAATVNVVNASCGNNNGGATVVNVMGGASPYQYSFNGSAFSTNNSVSGLGAGMHNVVIKDINSCTLAVVFNVSNIGGPTALNFTVNNVSCNGGNNGVINVSTTGGTAPYNYTLSPNNVTNGLGIFNNLNAGTYTISVKDANNCAYTSTVSISQPAPLSLSFNVTNVSCYSGNNGMINCVGSGGTSPYQFSLNGGAFQSSSTFSNLFAGYYNVTIKDNNNCLVTNTIQINQPTDIQLSVTTKNANCTTANGSATVNVTGGTPPYAYVWSSIGGNAPISNSLTAGNYTVNVMDINGCTKSITLTINSIPGGTAVITAASNVTCKGYNNGWATVSYVGNMTPPISYSWSNGQNTQTANNLAPGNYNCIIQDVCGCTSSIGIGISEPDSLHFSISSNPALCFNQNSGSASVSYISGGTPPFTYLWTPGGQTSATATNLVAGTYSCLITDANGCTRTYSVNVTQPSSVTITSTVNTAYCMQSNGAATVSASGGFPAYSYTWSTGTTGNVLSNVAAGTYTVMVKDANNCVNVFGITIPNTNGPTLTVTGYTNVSCYGGNNGVATTSVNGGVPPYSYMWSNGQNVGTAINLSAGIYTVSVTDAVGCVASASVQITQPPALSLNIIPQHPLCFNSNNGSATALVNGGTSPYSYTWSPVGGNASTASNLSAGIYIVNVKDAMNCGISGTVQLNNPPQMQANVNYTNVTCNGACNGIATANAINANGSITYYWIGGVSPQTTPVFNNLCPGNYTLILTDQNNCTASAVFSITEPPLLNVTITNSANVTCFGANNGYASVIASGGSPSYSYQWLPSGGNSFSANNLAPGTYTIKVTDSKNCQKQQVITITQPSPLQASVSINNVSCYGLNDGSGIVSAWGGTGPYNILWYPSLHNTFSANNLAPGTHTIQVTDANNCVTTITAMVNQPPQLLANVTTTNSNCNMSNGYACVMASGGAGGYSYQWSGSPTYTNACLNNVSAGIYTVMVKDANNCVVYANAVINDISGPVVSITGYTNVSCYGQNNGAAQASLSGGTPPYNIAWTYQGQSGLSITNLPAGNYGITVVDAAGCVGNATVNISQPSPLNSAIVNVGHVSCFGLNDGSATMLVNGGTPAYTYTWTGGSGVQNSQTAVSLIAGNYTCTVKDANGCTSTQTVQILQPNPIAIGSYTIQNVLCNGGNNGQIAANIVGGTPPYTFTWNPSNVNAPVISNLSGGSYTLNINDGKACMATFIFTVTEPAPLVANINSTPAYCGNAVGSATVQVSGGTPPYQYLWNTPNPQNTSIATNLSPNTWTCQVVDANNCIINPTVQIIPTPHPTITSTSFTPPLCYGQQNGAAGIQVTGGTSPYSYTWNAPSGGNTATLTGLGAGVYQVVVSDNYGCQTFTTVNVQQPNQVVINATPNHTICYGTNSQIFAAGTGGIASYTYTWIPSIYNGPGPYVVQPTVTTSYTVMVKDANGCVAPPRVITVFVNPPLAAVGKTLDVCDAHIAVLSPTITSLGNGGPYQFFWSDGTNQAYDSVMVNLQLGSVYSYSVIIKDGCTIPDAVANFVVNVKPLPSPTYSILPNKGCRPAKITFTATETNTNSINNYYWHIEYNTGSYDTTNGVFDIDVLGNPASIVLSNNGSYAVSIMVSNQYGCYVNIPFIDSIKVYPKPVAAFTYSPFYVDMVNPEVQFTNQSQGASQYLWNLGDYSSNDNLSTDTNVTHYYQYEGVYMVNLIATNQYGCKDTADAVIQVRPQFAVYIPNTFTPDGNDLNDVFIPVGIGIMEDEYQMLIYDRWGNLVFSSNNLKVGWDGSIKGDPNPKDGVYAYKITLLDVFGNKHEYVGHVYCQVVDRDRGK